MCLCLKNVRVCVPRRLPHREYENGWTWRYACKRERESVHVVDHKERKNETVTIVKKEHRSKRAAHTISISTTLSHTYLQTLLPRHTPSLLLRHNMFFSLSLSLPSLLNNSYFFSFLSLLWIDTPSPVRFLLSLSLSLFALCCHSLSLSFWVMYTTTTALSSWVLLWCEQASTKTFFLLLL